MSYLQGKDILDDLDVRASDLLQANGVIWVEGPSDRIYLRRWIELVTDKELIEDVHYTIMFYGGKLLANLTAKSPDEAGELISLIRINRNAAIVIDSDRHPNPETKGKRTQQPRMRLGKTKLRVREEIEALNGVAWITEGREVENYTPLHVYERVVGTPPPKSIDVYTKLPEHSFLAKFNKNKIDIAHSVAADTKLEDIKDHLDLCGQLETLCEHIRRWNKLD